MLFETLGDKRNSAVLFFHAMGVTGASSEPVAGYLQKEYFCILPTSTVYCQGQKYIGKADEVRQLERFLQEQEVKGLALVVASSIGADLAVAFLVQTRVSVEHVFFDGGQFARIGKGLCRFMTPFLYFAIKSLYWSGGKRSKKSCGVMTMLSNHTSLRQARRCAMAICTVRWRTVWRIRLLALAVCTTEEHLFFVWQQRGSFQVSGCGAKSISAGSFPGF